MTFNGYKNIAKNLISLCKKHRRRDRVDHQQLCHGAFKHFMKTEPWNNVNHTFAFCCVLHVST